VNSIPRKEIKRKIFHLGAFVYVAGLFFIPLETYIGVLGIALVLVAVLEYLRTHVGFFRDLSFRWFGEIFRDEERGRLSGVFWMILGVFSTVILIKPVPVAFSVLLYLILGDTAASLVGMGFGGPRWPRSKKTISGSLACFVVCLAVGAVLLRQTYGWTGIFLGALAASISEFGFFGLNDNFFMPLVSAMVLMVYFGLRPIFF